VCLYLPLAFVQVREARTLLFGVMVIILRVFRDFWAYMLLWTYGMVGIIVWMWKYGCCRMNSGETRHSRPGETCRNRPKLVLELSRRRRVFVWARHHLAQAREARLSEDAWGLKVCAAWVAQARRIFLGEGYSRSGE